MVEKAEAAAAADTYYCSEENLKLVDQVLGDLKVDEKGREQLGCFTSGGISSFDRFFLLDGVDLLWNVAPVFPLACQIIATLFPT